MNIEDVLDLSRDVDVLASHYWQARGMTYGSPDICACGARTLPVAGGEEAGERRARAFAIHQVTMLAIARGELP